MNIDIPEIAEFANLMQKELNANSHKGDWHIFCENQNIAQLFFELENHKAKLLIAMKSKDMEKIAEYVADCGNALMFIAKSYGVI